MRCRRGGLSVLQGLIPSRPRAVTLSANYRHQASPAPQNTGKHAAIPKVCFLHANPPFMAAALTASDCWYYPFLPDLFTAEGSPDTTKKGLRLIQNASVADPFVTALSQALFLLHGRTRHFHLKLAPIQAQTHPCTADSIFLLPQSAGHGYLFQ